MTTELDYKKLPPLRQEVPNVDAAKIRQQASVKAWRSIFPAKIDRSDIPQKMTPAFRAFLGEHPDYAAKVERHYLRDMSEAEQIKAIAASWGNLRSIKNPIDKVEIMAVALDARAYDLLSSEAKRSMVIQTIMLRKDGHYIKRISPDDLNEEAVLAAVRRNFEIFADIENPTPAMISAAVAQFEKNIRKNVYAASLIYEAVAPHLSRDTRAYAEREFIMNGCSGVINVEGGDTSMLEDSYHDIGAYFGLNQDEHIRKVAECLYRLTARLSDQAYADEIRIVLRLKYDAVPDDLDKGDSE